MFANIRNYLSTNRPTSPPDINLSYIYICNDPTRFASDTYDAKLIAQFNQRSQSQTPLDDAKSNVDKNIFYLEQQHYPPKTYPLITATSNNINQSDIVKAIFMQNNEWKQYRKFVKYYPHKIQKVGIYYHGSNQIVYPDKCLTQDQLPNISFVKLSF